MYLCTYVLYLKASLIITLILMNPKNSFPRDRKTQLLKLLSRLRNEVKYNTLTDDEMETLLNILNGAKPTKQDIFKFILGDYILANTTS